MTVKNQQSNSGGEVIRSAQNERLKLMRKLSSRSTRSRLGLFLAEGEDLVQQAQQHGWEPQQTLVAEGSGIAGIEVEKRLLDQASGLGSGSRVAAVYKQRQTDPVGPLAVYLYGVGDPGNVGTIVGSAVAFGASCVVCGPETADPYGPKAVRASMGAIFQMPIVSNFTDPIDQLPGIKLALVAGRGDTLTGPFDQQLTVVVGSERSGLPDAVVNSCDKVVQIPIRYESLNAAMATTVALYEVTRTAGC